MSTRKRKEEFCATMSVSYANEDSDQWELVGCRYAAANRVPGTARAVAGLIETEMINLFYGLPIPEVGDSVAAKLRLTITIERRPCNVQ